MAYLTSERVGRAVKNSGKTPGNLIKRAAEASYDVFLSHSSKDREEIPGTIAFLEEFGVTVYIDKQDYELPIETSSETASILQNRIRECRKLIVLVS